MRRIILLAACGLAASLAAVPSCITEEYGNHRATKTGDLSRALAERVDPNEIFVDLCGDPNITHDGEDRFRRQPYLELTDQDSTTVSWTAVGSSGGTVVVTDPDKEPIGVFEATEEPAGTPEVTQFTVKLTGLEPDTVYCYTVNDEGGELIGRIGFRTSKPDGSVRFLAFGDSGDGSDDQLALLEQMPTVGYELMLHVGDIAYQSGTFAEFDQNHFAIYHELLRHVALFPVPGNHEYVTDDAAPYRAIFHLPNNERYYSFDRGDVHFVGLDTEQVGNTQRDWLDADLKKSDKRWKVAYLHRPPYSSGEHGSDLKVRDTFAPVFEKYGVDLVIAGHDHHYERMKPQNGVAYVLTGGGGGGTRPASGDDFTAFAEDVIHYVYVTIDGDELLLHAIDASGQEFDQLHIAK